jgi:hypothetical protein
MAQRSIRRVFTNPLATELDPSETKKNKLISEDDITDRTFPVTA